ncbi:MAG: glycosyltransferase [Erysipelotrichaceae bacterium]|nr:glycosyltransferase [Erysipelotrichaceae bacterium]
MKIGIFSDAYIPFTNGVTTSILMLKQSLEEKGHTVYIVTVSTSRKFEIEDQGKIIRLPSLPIPMYNYRISFLYHKEAMKMIQSWNLDVIHSQTEFGIGMYARIVSNKYNIPLVHTCHTMYEDYVHYINGGHFNKLFKNIVKKITQKFCQRKNLELIVPTEKISKLYKEKYHINMDIHVVPTGIDIDKFDINQYPNFDKLKLRNELGIHEDDFVVLFVGRIAQEKNLGMLIQVMNQLPNNIKLLIVGDGPQLSKLKSISNQNVIYTGSIDWNDNIQYYYFIADCFATASKSETQGLTVIEAMAAKLPVIAINDESFTNTLKHGYNGYIFDNERQYQEAIIKIYENQDILEMLSQGAYETSKEYSASLFGDRLLEVYKKVLQGKNK